MYQRDYLMRQIEQAARALAAIMKKALGGEADQALTMFDEVYQPLLGVSQRVVSTLTDEQLISLLTSGSMPDLRRVASVREVVKSEADVHAEDALFEAIDDLPADTSLVDAGIAFYQRLLALQDADLETGGLPRDEVKSSLAELLRRQLPEEDPDAWPDEDQP